MDNTDGSPKQAPQDNGLIFIRFTISIAVVRPESEVLPSTHTVSHQEARYSLSHSPRRPDAWDLSTTDVRF